MSTNQLLPVWMTVSHVVVNGTSMGTSITTDQVTCQWEDNTGIQVKWTGTPTGTLAVQISQDPTNLGWVTIPDSAYTIAPDQPSGSSGSDYFDLTLISAPFVRLVYTRVSGSGALYAKITAKSV